MVNHVSESLAELTWFLRVLQWRHNLMRRKLYFLTIVLLCALYVPTSSIRAQADPLQPGIKLLYDDHNCKAAIIEFTKVIGKQPRLANAYAYRSIAENRCKQYPQALADAGLALKLDAKSVLGLMARGEAY